MEEQYVLEVLRDFYRTFHKKGVRGRIISAKREGNKFTFYTEVKHGAKRNPPR